MKTLKDFLRIIDLQTIAVTVLAIVATYLSRRFDYVAEMPIDLLGVAVVFPLVFSINSAYRMREDALQAFAGLKGSAISLYYAHRDWGPGDRGSGTQAKRLIEEFLAALVRHLRAEANDQARKANLDRIFEIFSEFSRSIEALRSRRVSTNEIARANQYLRDMVVDFERMSNIARYRTPISLRAFTRVFLNTFPIIFAPHFAHIDYPDYPFIGYVMAGLYAFVLVSLDNVQDHLENPFDGIGSDDLMLNVVDEMLDFLEPTHD